MLELVIKIKKQFFDQTRVIRDMDRKTRKVMSKGGAYIRRIAQTSMRTKKGSSPPGSPPYSHGQKKLRKNIFFAYDPDRKNLIVGPVMFERTKDQKVPSVLERGGKVTRFMRGKTKTYNYEERPYMEPAGEKVAPQIVQWYKDA